MPEVPVLDAVVLDREGPQDRLLVLLHGYGEPTEPLTDRLPLIDPDGRYKVVVPSAPFERGGLAIWHRALTTAPEEAAVQFHLSLTAIDRLLGEVEDDLGLAASEAVVGGFSQGGGLSMGLLMSAGIVNRPAAGFGVCSFPPAFDGFRADRNAITGARFWLTSSRNDRFAPIESSRGAAAMLRDLGVTLSYVETDGEHVMTNEAAEGIGRWLDLLDAAERGSGAVPYDVELLDGVSGRVEFYDERWEFVD